MILDYFTSLSKKAQQELVLAQGTFLFERKDGPFRVMLYQLCAFYVEVHFFHLYSKVAYFSAFDSTDHLDVYLDTFNLSSLLQDVLS